MPLDLNAVQCRLNAHAARRQVSPPETLLDADGGPSQSILDYCDVHDLTLDWVYTGRQSGRCEGERHVSPTRLAYDLAALIDVIACAVDNDGTAVPLDRRGIEPSLRIAQSMAEDLIEKVEDLVREKGAR